MSFIENMLFWFLSVTYLLRFVFIQNHRTPLSFALFLFVFTKRTAVNLIYVKRKAGTPRGEAPRHPLLSQAKKLTCLKWSGRRDSNPESPDPKSGMLAVTPRPDLYNFKINNRFIVFGDLSLFISIIL